MFTIQDNNDTIYNIDMVQNVDNVDKMLAKCYFYTLPTQVNFFLHFLIVIGILFKPFIFFSRKMELCGGSVPVAKMQGAET